MTPLLAAAVAMLGGLAGLAAHRLSGGSLSRPLAAGSLGGGPAPRAPVAGAVQVSAVVRPSRLGPLVTAVVGAVATTAVVARFGANADVVAWVWLVVLGLLLGVVDVREHRLPDRVLLPGAGIALVLLTGAAVSTGRWGDLERALLAGLACFALLLVMALLSPSGLGMGDVKLVALTGTYLGWLGWDSVVGGLLLAFLAQATLALALLAGQRLRMGADLAFGPALLAGSVVAALLSGPWEAAPW